MTEQPVLTEAEWLLVLETLERESYFLPQEINHTYKRAYRAELRNRWDAINSVMGRIRTYLPDAVLSEEAVSHT